MGQQSRCAGRSHRAYALRSRFNAGLIRRWHRTSSREVAIHLHRRRCRSYRSPPRPNSGSGNNGGCRSGCQLASAGQQQRAGTPAPARPLRPVQRQRPGHKQQKGRPSRPTPTRPLRVWKGLRLAISGLGQRPSTTSESGFGIMRSFWRAHPCSGRPSHPDVSSARRPRPGVPRLSLIAPWCPAAWEPLRGRSTGRGLPAGC